jgi:hypothetical protein
MEQCTDAVLVKTLDMEYLLINTHGAWNHGRRIILPDKVILEEEE